MHSAVVYDIVYSIPTHKRTCVHAGAYTPATRNDGGTLTNASLREKRRCILASTLHSTTQRTHTHSSFPFSCSFSLPFILSHLRETTRRCQKRWKRCRIAFEFCTSKTAAGHGINKQPCCTFVNVDEANVHCRLRAVRRRAL